MHIEAMFKFRKAVTVALLCIGLGAPLQVHAWVVYTPGAHAYNNHWGYTQRHYYRPGFTYYSYRQPYFQAVPGWTYYYPHSSYNRPYYGGHRHQFRSRHFGFRHRPKCR